MPLSLPTRVRIKRWCQRRLVLTGRGSALMTDHERKGEIHGA
jgi:hypothetical protein